MYLSYVGIRVRNFERSVRFYTDVFGLKLIAQGDNRSVGAGLYALLRDDVSGQRLELNWYPEGSTYGGPYVPGEGLDHVAFRVDDVRETLRYLAKKKIQAVEIDPKLTEPRSPESPGWFRLAYVTDPDGNWIELYQEAESSASFDSNAY